MASNKHRSKLMFICTTPKEYCKGKTYKEDTKFHTSQEIVKACKRNYLVNILGATQIGSRDFALSNNGPIVALNKKTLRAKPGKENRQMGRARRVISF